MLKSRFNSENDKWFLGKVRDKTLKVYCSGKIFNRKTGRYIGALGSGDYIKISMKDFETNKIRNMQVHRLVWIVHKGLIPAGYEVDHINDNKLFNSLSNLQLLTAVGNSQKSIVTGAKQNQFGSFNNMSKLTEKKVRKIRRLFAEGVTAKKLAKKYKVHRVTIRDVVKRKTWNHIM